MMEGTYTKFVMDTLCKKGIVLICRGRPLHIGGPRSINREMMNRLLARQIRRGGKSEF